MNKKFGCVFNKTFASNKYTNLHQNYAWEEHITVLAKGRH